MGKRGLLVVLGFLAAGACIWRMVDSANSRGLLHGAPTRPSSKAAQPSALLAESAAPKPEVAGSVRTEEGGRTVAPGPQRAAVADSEEVKNPPEGTLVVRVLRSDTGKAVPGERVALRRVDDKNMLQHVPGGFGDALRTDEGGRCTFRIPAGKPAFCCRCAP
jgi:hypothetical protein